MSLKQSNEITVKLKCDLDEIYSILEEKGFKKVDEFSMEDAYFVSKVLNLNEMSTRDILSNAVLVRNIIDKMPYKVKKKIVFKIKDFDEFGNIINQEAIFCEVLDIQDAKKLLDAIGYKEIMVIKENDIVYEKNDLGLAIKNIENGDKLIEIETQDNEELDTIDKLIKKVEDLNIPIYTDSYFVKKAEVELNKVLGR